MKSPALILFLLAIPVSAQQPKPTAPAPAPEGKSTTPCVILKRMGPADEITSHLYSFGIRGKQFQYVEGTLPQAVSFHGRLTDHDARKIMDKGGKIQLLEPGYSAADLEAARRQCAGLPPLLTEAANGTAKTGATTSATAKPTVGTEATTPNQTKSASASLATISLSSNPDGADIFTDDAFVGSAPAALKLSAGKHIIKVTMAGFKDWSREITALADSDARLVATLEKLN